MLLFESVNSDRADEHLYFKQSYIKENVRDADQYWILANNQYTHKKIKIKVEHKVHTFHRIKMISARSSRPPIILPIRIHREIGIERPFRTSNTVYTHNTIMPWTTKFFSYMTYVQYYSNAGCVWVPAVFSPLSKAQHYPVWSD